MHDNIVAIIKQRLIRYPLQYIIGRWNFFGREYFVGPGVLIPRSDTETLIDVCLDAVKGKEKPRVLDLCAGSGCIGITIANRYKETSVTLVEKYDVPYAKAVSHGPTLLPPKTKPETSVVCFLQ